MSGILRSGKAQQKMSPEFPTMTELWNAHHKFQARREIPTRFLVTTHLETRLKISLIPIYQVSLWTAFCERDMPDTALSSCTREDEETICFPHALLVLEHHLRQPVRTHNDKHLKRLLKVDELSHDYVEGEVPQGAHLSELPSSLYVHGFMLCIVGINHL